MEILIPPPLARGDRIVAIAPSSPFEHAPVLRGLGWLAERFDVRYRRSMLERAGYLAGSDERRAAELAEALVDPSVRLVIAARGGYGALRFAHRLPWAELRRSPKWICGFSDVTALHVEASRVGVATLHGPHLGALGRSDARARGSFLDACAAPAIRRAWNDLAPIAAGRASGPLFGGNLTVLHACAAAGRLVVPDRAIVVLEDVTERPYRIDRMLTTLRTGGFFDRAGGFVLGDFTSCEPGSDGVSVRDVVAAGLVPIGAPVAGGLPIGHEVRNDPIVLGLEAELDVSAERAALTLAPRG
jgi:muramoyltetrapeptide carboxypeptidase